MRYYYGWNIVVLTGLCQTVSLGIAINCLSLYIPYWSKDLSVPISVLALCYTLNSIGYCLLAPVTGAWTARVSVRRMMTVGLLGIACLFALASQVRQAWQLLTLFATVAPVSMILSGGLTSQVLVARWFDNRRGLALAISTIGQIVAGIVLPPLFGRIIPLIGWRPLFMFIAAAIAIAFTPIAYFVLRDRPTNEMIPHGEFPEVVQTPDGQRHQHQEHGKVSSYRKLLTDRRFWLVAVINTMGMVVSGVMIVNIAPIALDRGLSPPEAGTLIAIFSVAAAANKIIAGYAIDKVAGRVVLGTIITMIIAGTLTLKVASSFIGLAFGVFLVAGSIALQVPMAALSARLFGTQNFGRVMGALLVFLAVAAFAPPLLAKIREATQSYNLPFLLLAGSGAIGLVASQFLNVGRRIPPGSVEPAGATSRGDVPS